MNNEWRDNKHDKDIEIIRIIKYHTKLRRIMIIINKIQEIEIYKPITIFSIGFNDSLMGS